jgi:hypothetical protein
MNRSAERYPRPIGSPAILPSKVYYGVALLVLSTAATTAHSISLANHTRDVCMSPVTVYAYLGNSRSLPIEEKEPKVAGTGSVVS